MRKVERKRGQRKLEVVVPEASAQALADLDTRVEMIQALIPLGLKAVEEELKAAVTALAGPRYQRGPDDRRYYRWGREHGSVYLADQKVPVRVPRVRDVHADQEVRLPVYERLQAPRGGDAQLVGRVLRGLGCRNYRETAALVPEVFGLSASTVSRRFIRASAAKLQALMERDLSGQDLVALFMDGKSFGDDEMVIAIGVTLEGQKVMLGMVQTGSENTSVCRAFLKSLVARGLRYEQGLLVVVDGAKGFHRGVREVFGRAAVIQRCRWHKRELRRVRGMKHLPAMRAAIQREMGITKRQAAA